MNVVCPQCGYAFVSAEEVPACPRCMYQFSSLLKDIGIKKKSEKPLIAGILLIIVGILGLLVTVPIFACAPLLEQIEIPVSASLEGNVTDISGNAIENATVTVLDKGISAKTDSNGSYKITGLSAGMKKIQISKVGYQTKTVKLFLYGKTAENFKLNSGTGAEPEEDKTIELFAVLYSCGIIFFICSIFVLLGGIYSLKRKHFGVCVVGAVLGLISPVLGIGTILSVVALIFLALSRAEFK